ncbi:CDP-alcohol phosphatidyltransferase family protein [Nocardiopsis sp. CNT-189]
MGPVAGAAAQPVLLGLVCAAIGLGAVGWLAGLGYAAALCALLAAAVRRSGARPLSPADKVTLARAVLVGGVAALVADRALDGAAGTDGPAALAIAVLAAAGLVLDGVDGRVARRTGTSSPRGARFDMEVDAFLILVLSLHAALFLGPWTAAIGAMRYAFAAAARVLPRLRGELPPSRARKAVAVLQAVALIAVAPDLLPRPAAAAVAGLALALLAWSFGRDVRWLWRAGRAEPGPDRAGGGAAGARTGAFRPAGGGTGARPPAGSEAPPGSASGGERRSGAGGQVRGGVRTSAGGGAPPDPRSGGPRRGRGGAPPVAGSEASPESSSGGEMRSGAGGQVRGGVRSPAGGGAPPDPRSGAEARSGAFREARAGAPPARNGAAPTPRSSPLPKARGGGLPEPGRTGAAAGRPRRAGRTEG